MSAVIEAVARAADDVVQRASSGRPRVPGVVAGVTDRDGTVYLGHSGVRDLASGAPMTDDTVLAVFSTTKAITGTVVLQLVEQGRLDLDAPAKRYAPVLGQLQVLAGFDERGPVLRPPVRDVTTRHLLTHTAGFGYDFFNHDFDRLAREYGQPDIVTATREALRTPLLFDPGDEWEYGSSIDWAGQVVEGITGQRLGAAMRERVLDPLGMADTAFTLRDDLRPRLATVHRRDPGGDLRPTAFALPEPEVDMGGHGLYSTVPDYLRFIRMWLNDGRADDGTPVLGARTVEYAATNHIGDLRVKALTGVRPKVSNDAEFFPGMPKSWGLTFMINDEDADTGRPAGSLAWAGLANLYYWIDRHTGIGGYWATQILPFADATALNGYLSFEAAVYAARTA